MTIIARERYGVSFPFQDSESGFFLKTTDTLPEEIKADLIHIPNIVVNEIKIETLEDIREQEKELSNSNHPSISSKNNTIDTDLDDRIYRVAGDGTEEYTAKIFIDYTIKDDVFGTRDFVIINL